jgi:hypothetical protein
MLPVSKVATHGRTAVRGPDNSGALSRWLIYTATTKAPRLATDANQAVVWRYEGRARESAPNGGITEPAFPVSTSIPRRVVLQLAPLNDRRREDT